METILHAIQNNNNIGMSQPPKKTFPTDDKMNDFDWSSVFPPGRIRTQIQLEDDNIGCLPKKTLELISACSTLFLRKIVQTSCAAKDNISETVTTGSPPSPSTILLSAQDMQKGIQEGPNCLLFLDDVVAQAVHDDDRKVASRKTKKRKAVRSEDTCTAQQPPGVSSKIAKLPKMSNAASGISKETLEQAVAISQQRSSAIQTITKDSVILDEEDYD